MYFRKAVKAAIVLLPLLGITNIVNLIDPPAESVVQFGLWSYSTYFLVSFQGFFISLLYCYLNGEVRIISVTYYINLSFHLHLTAIPYIPNGSYNFWVLLVLSQCLKTDFGNLLIVMVMCIAKRSCTFLASIGTGSIEETLDKLPRE